MNEKFDWYSGLIRIDNNRLGDWKEESERLEYLEVYRGDLKQVMSLSNEELQIFKEEQFAHFKKTKAYEAVYKEWEERSTAWAVHKINDLIKDMLLKRYSRTLVEAAYTNAA